MQMYFHRLERLSKGTSNVAQISVKYWSKVHILTLNKLKKNCVEETGDELFHFLKRFMRSNACPECNNSASNYYVKKNNFLSIDLMANEVCMSIAL